MLQDVITYFLLTQFYNICKWGPNRRPFEYYELYYTTAFYAYQVRCIWRCVTIMGWLRIFTIWNWTAIFCANRLTMFSYIYSTSIFRYSDFNRFQFYNTRFFSTCYQLHIKHLMGIFVHWIRLEILSKFTYVWSWKDNGFVPCLEKATLK